MKRVIKWINRIASLLIYGLLICIVFLIVSSKLSGGTPTVLGHELLMVMSGSMEPGIKTGSIISVTPVNQTDKFKIGDIITYKPIDAPKNLITHRIVKVQTTNGLRQYITKGDNNDGNDYLPVPAVNVVAQYDHFTIPYAGYLGSFIKSKLGNVLLLIVPGILLILWALYRVWKTINSLETKEDTKKVG